MTFTPARQLSVNGITINMEDHGSGQPLVMLHGLNSSIGGMRTEIDWLSRHFRVIAIDLRGHGRSSRPAAYTLQDHTRDVLGVMDALKLDTAFLMGTSMGSYVAQAVALAAPERIRKLVLVVSKSNGKTSSTARFLAQHAAEISVMSQPEIQAFINRSIFAPQTPESVQDILTALAAEQQASGLAPTPAQAQAANDALTNFDFRAQLPGLQIPVLVVSGRHDPLNTVSDGEELAKLVPGARFVVMERSGHVPALEQPEELLGEIEGFLRS